MPILSFLAAGGGNEVGASCRCYAFPDRLVIVDAGARPLNFSNYIRLIRSEKDKILSPSFNAAQRELSKKPLPEFSAIPDGYDNIDIVLTHGHFDHVGAIVQTVKFLLARNPRAKIRIFGTGPTLEMTLHHAHEGIKIEREEQPYEKHDIEVVRQRFQNPIELCDDFSLEHAVQLYESVSIIPPRACHILGAMQVVFVYKGEIIGVDTGDISLEHTFLAGAPLVSLPGIRFMTVDATRLLEPRVPRSELQGDFMLALQDAVYSHGRSARVFSFAIDRTNVAYELAKAACPDVPIWIDGVGVRTIAQIYMRELGERLHSELGSSFIMTDEQRLQISRSPEPTIVIVPSAMQFAGFGDYWFREGVGRNDRLFAHIGYCDPCSPEYALFEESHRFSVLEIGPRQVIRLCDTYHQSISGHWTGEDVLDARYRLQPDMTLLTHGDNEKMDEFAALHAGFRKGKNLEPIQLL